MPPALTTDPGRSAGRTVQQLALQPNPGSTDGRTSQQHALQSLSLVGCKGLRCCHLGLMPADGTDATAFAPSQATAWVPAACRLAGINVLNVMEHSMHASCISLGKY